MKNYVKRFGRNSTGRDLIVGDIHGTFSKLCVELAALDFDPTAGDRLFSVGDLVDRGPESMDALKWVQYPWFHAVAGNHEDFAIRWPNGHMEPAHYAQNGGAWNIANDLTTRAEVAQALGELPVAIELETSTGLVGIVHACCPFGSWKDFTFALEAPETSKKERQHLIDMAQWSRERIERMDDDEVSGVRAVVVGHTPVPNWTSLGNTLYIDTMGWRGKPFTILDAETLRPATAKSPLVWCP